jgi:hypothetical protein
MEEIIASFDIDYTEFHEILKHDNSAIVGGAPLACLLKQHDIDPGFEPQSINIFMPMGRALARYDDDEDDITNMGAFLESQGFTQDLNYDASVGALAALPVFNKFHPVCNFTKDGKEVRIICVDYYDIEVFIKRTFNLSVGLCWWNPAKSCGLQSYIETFDLEHTLCKEMYVIPPVLGRTVNPKPVMKNVIDKYIKRGFTLIVNLPE